MASGARPLIPTIEGLEKIDYLTNENVLDLKEQPDSVAMIGGGYVSAEYSHFFNAMGTDVTTFQRNKYLVPDEEPKISRRLEEIYDQKMDVFTSAEAQEVKEDEDGYIVVGKNTKNGETEKVEVDEVMVAAGRKSNADLLEVEETGVETGQENYGKLC